MSVKATIATAIVLAGCAPVASGNIVTDSRQVDPFDSIEVRGITVDLIVDPSTDHSVDVVYDDNLQDRIRTKVDGATLQISVSGVMNPLSAGERVVRVTTPDLEGLILAGGAQIDAGGELDQLDLDVSGGSTARLERLTVQTAFVEISGGGKAHLNVSDAIDGAVQAGATLNIAGDPRTENVSADAGAIISR